MNNKKCVLTGVIEEEEKVEIVCVRTRECPFICVEGQPLLIRLIPRGK